MAKNKKINLKLPTQGSFTGNASLIKRVLAFMIDIILLEFLVLTPFKNLFFRIIPDTTNITSLYTYLTNHPELTGKLTTLIMVVSVFVMLYFIILEWRIGQTLGKALVGIKVISLTEPKKKGIGFFSAIVRSLFLIPFIPFILLWIIEPLVIIFTRTNQRLLEMLSKTKTVERYSL